MQIKAENLSTVKDLLLKDEIVSRASMSFKEGKAFGVDGYICYISGTDEHCKHALDIVKAKKTDALAEEIEENKKQKIIKKIKEEEDKAMEGFGSFLG